MNTEYTANVAFQSAAAERARWAAVLAKPATHPVRKSVAKKSVFLKLRALFA